MNYFLMVLACLISLFSNAFAEELRAGGSNGIMFADEVIYTKNGVVTSAVTYIEPRAYVSDHIRPIFASAEVKKHSDCAEVKDGSCREGNVWEVVYPAYMTAAGLCAALGYDQALSFGTTGNSGFRDLVLFLRNGAIDKLVSWYAGPGIRYERFTSITCSH